MKGTGERYEPSIRILVVDDHPAVREGLALLVSSDGMEVCAEAGRRDDALARAEECRPDVAVVDLSLDGEDGMPLVTDLRERGVPALVYSMHGDPPHVQAAFAAGAVGYATKSEFGSVLLDGIRAARDGRRFVSPRAAAALADGLDGMQGGDAIASLSGQEKEVYRLIGRGESTPQIACALGISNHTVESYYARIQVKLGVSGMYELRRHAIGRFRKQED